MKIKSMLKMVAAVLLITSMAASNALAADGTGTATASVVIPLAMTEIRVLNFGSFSPSASPGVVHIANGSWTASGGVTLIAGGGGITGIFGLTGQPNTTYSRSIDSVMTLSNGSDIMTANLNSLGSLINSGGTGAVVVVGDLSVAANQPTGVYTGTYNLSVNYN